MKASSPSIHGASVSAPLEEFAVGESPPPGKTARRPRRNPPPEEKTSSVAARALAGLKLVLGLVVVVAASSAVAWSLHRYALTTTRFGVRKVALEGNKRLGPDEVRRLAGVEMGKNLFAFDTHQAEERLLVRIDTDMEVRGRQLRLRKEREYQAEREEATHIQLRRPLAGPGREALHCVTRPICLHEMHVIGIRSTQR